MNDSGIAGRLARVCGEIQSAEEEAGRARSVTLVAVSKTVEADGVSEAYLAGQRVFGENRVQEADGKMRVLAPTMPDAVWHLIGHLQTNKARQAAGLFGFIESVDSLRLAERLDHAAAVLGRRLPILIEVNVGGEVTKGGFPVDEVIPAVAELRQRQHLELRGLMTVPPQVERPEEARPIFRRLAELKDEIQWQFDLPQFDQLSMGMSGDFKVAIQEGATIVRIGRAIFGDRPQPLAAGERVP